MELLKINDIGTNLHIGGVVLTGMYNLIVMLPNENLPDKKIVTVHPNQEQWKDIIRQMDVQEIVLSEGDQKSVLRKTQRQLDEYITWEVFRRDEYTCRYCGINDVPMSYDHIKLWEKGGPNTVENGVCACKKCNKTRGNIEYKEWINSDYYKEKCQNVHPKFQKMNLELVCVYESFPNRISKKSR